MSQRHNHEDGGILDAARSCVLDVGFRRTTLTDVARRAGVSRMTLYRRYPDLEGIFAALMTREFGRVVAEAGDLASGRVEARSGGAPAAPTTRARVVAMVVHGSRALAEDPLFARLLDVDPELLLPYVTRRLGGMQKIAVAAGAAALADADGSVRTDAPPEALSAGVELIARGFVLASHGELGLDPWAELGRAVDGYLRP
jgi:AcrR family transcriptional regulator